MRLNSVTVTGEWGERRGRTRHSLCMCVCVRERHTHTHTHTHTHRVYMCASVPTHPLRQTHPHTHVITVTIHERCSVLFHVPVLITLLEASSKSHSAVHNTGVYVSLFPGSVLAKSGEPVFLIHLPTQGRRLSFKACTGVGLDHAQYSGVIT